MNKIYTEDSLSLKKEKVNNVFISVSLYSIGVIVTLVCLLLQTRENLALTTIISLTISILTFSFASYLLLFVNRKITSYLKLQNSKSINKKKLKLLKILNNDVFINYLLFKNVIFADNKNNKIELRVLSSEIDQFNIGEEYTLEITNDVVISYEK